MIEKRPQTHRPIPLTNVKQPNSVYRPFSISIDNLRKLLCVFGVITVTNPEQVNAHRFLHPDLHPEALV